LFVKAYIEHSKPSSLFVGEGFRFADSPNQMLATALRLLTIMLCGKTKVLDFLRTINLLTQKGVKAHKQKLQIF
jgi:hypothetical protein